MQIFKCQIFEFCFDAFALLYNTKGLIFLIIVLLFTAGACSTPRKALVLPKGDIPNGKLAFQELGCNGCHSVGDISWQATPRRTELRLGGTVTQIKTYGELVTSIINPSHRISPLHTPKKVMKSNGESKMTIYNEVMTVQQLVDLVTFLQTEYEVEIPSNPYLFPDWDELSY